jgi:putative ABC transport system permease protein
MTRRGLPDGARLTSLAGLSVRSLRARPLRAVLTTGAIVLGVGMVFGILLLTGTIHSTFARLYDSIYGRADLVVAGENSVGALPASTIDRVRATRGVETASGSVFSFFRLLDERGEVDRSQSGQLYVVGVDPDQPDTTSAQTVAGREPVAGRGEIQVARDWAETQGLDVGDALRVSTPSGAAQLTVAGLFTFEGGLDLGGYGTASMPLADARRVMDKPDAWDEIDVVVEDGVTPASVQRELDATLGRGVEIATPDAKSDEIQDQIATLDVILFFFGGIALFTGAFLILNSFSMTVLQRMRELGTLCALGAGNLRVTRAILAEALVLGVVGSVLGLALGAGLALLLIQAMRSFGMPVSTVEFSVGAAVGAVVVGVVATLAGAIWPAVRAGRIPPIRALSGGGAPPRALSRGRAIAGLAMFVPGMAIGGYAFFGTNAPSTFVSLAGVVGTMVMFVGMVRLAPFVVLPLVRLLGVPLRRVMPAEGRLAVDAARANPGRTAATAATLLVALSVVVVNATVASSFVGSVQDELDQRFARDLTVQPIGYSEYGPPQAGLSTRLRAEIAALPEAGAVARRRAFYLTPLPGGDGEGVVIGYEPREYHRVDAIDYGATPTAQALRGLERGGIVVAKAYAQDQGVEIGDRIRLAGAAGARTAPVVAIADTLEAGGANVQISLRTMEEVYGIRNDSTLVVKAASPEVRDELAARVDALLARDYPGLEALSNAEFKQSTTAAIDQQFAFFNAIVMLALIVGVLGIVNTLTMSVIERTREIGVLRALGASRWRVRRTMADESLLIALAGTLSGVGIGLGVALVWLQGMQQTTFPGMTIHLPWPMLASLAVLGVVMGVVASILPARRAARLDPLTALRYE